MPNKGIFWAFELGIGLLLLTTLLYSHPIAAKSHAPELAFQLCLDLQEIWMQGEEINSIADGFFPEKTIRITQTHPLPTTQNTAVCHATRVRNGLIEKQFIAIEW